MSNFITVAQAGEIIGVTPARVRALIKANLLPAEKLSPAPNAPYLIKREDAVNFKRGQPGKRRS